MSNTSPERVVMGAQLRNPIRIAVSAPLVGDCYCGEPLRPDGSCWNVLAHAAIERKRAAQDKHAKPQTLCTFSEPHRYAEPLGVTTSSDSGCW